MENLYTTIEISEIPFHPVDFVEHFYTDQRVRLEGLHTDVINITDKYFRSVDFPLTYQKHNIQSKICDKYSLTIYAKESTNIDIVKQAGKVIITDKAGTLINAKILEISKEAVSPTKTFRYEISFYSQNIDAFTINNFLTSENLLNQSYSGDLVKCVATGGKSFYTTRFVLGTSTFPTTSDFDPYYFYLNNNLYFIIPYNTITASLCSTSIDVTSNCIKSANNKFVEMSPRSWTANYIRIGVDGLADQTGFVEDEVCINWTVANAINLTFNTKLLPIDEASDVKEKKSEATGIDIVYSSTNNNILQTRFYMTREDANIARSYIPRCDTIYIEYDGIKYYAYERIIPDIPKKDDLIGIQEVNLNINHNLNYFYNFV